MNGLSLDRQEIEKKDFPIGRRGYEPEAVDAHLARLASEYEALQRQAGRRSGATLATTASEQVRSIVQAAETSAAEIERDAEDEAARIRQEAAAEADRRRQEAIARSQEHVGKVHEATALMLQRVDAMESELGALIESLRTGANRLNADLSLLQGNMGDLSATAETYPAGAGRAMEPVTPPPPPTPPAPEPELELEPEPALYDEPEPVAVHAPTELSDHAVPDDRLTTPPHGDKVVAGDTEDVEGARLVALNMALNGDPREKADEYLAENFDLSDRQALLDEVYSTVEG